MNEDDRNSVLLKVAALDHKVLRSALARCVDAMETLQATDRITRRNANLWQTGGIAEQALSHGQKVLLPQSPDQHLTKEPT